MPSVPFAFVLLAATLALCLALPPLPAAAQVKDAEVAETVKTDKTDEVDEVSPTPTPPATAPTDLWTRLRSGYALPALDLHSTGPLATRIAHHVRWYQSHPAHVQRTFARARLYLFDIAQAVEKEGMPLEIALLPAVESAFQTGVCSHAAACGLWQFISPTASRFDLKQHLFVDDRRHIRAATTAALRYLKELHTRFHGDWQLALAAYNCGEGCIEAAVRRAKARGLPGRFEDLKLVDETAQYVPRLLALAQVVADPARHGMALPELANAPYFVGVPITRDINVALAAQLAGLSLPDFEALNPQHKKPVIVAATNAELFVPAAHAARLREALLHHRGPLSTWAAITLNKTGSVAALAQQHQMDVQQLRQVNGIGPNRLVRVGSTLIVPLIGDNHLALDISAAVAERSALLTLQAPRLRKKDDP